MTTSIEKQYLIFTVHDSRLEHDKSCVYVGMTSQADLNQYMPTVFREHLPQLVAEMAKDNHHPKIETSGERMTKDEALRLKAKTLMKYRSTGSPVSNSAIRSGRMFTIIVNPQLNVADGQVS